MTIEESRKNLLNIWVLGSILFGLLLLVQYLFGKYGDRYVEVLGWMALVTPTLALMIGIYLGKDKKKDLESEEVDGTAYNIVKYCSILYFALIIGLFLIEPFLGYSPYELIKFTKAVVGVLGESALTGGIAYFFIKK